MSDLRERRRHATRAEITEAALLLFEEKGVDGTTIDDIARKAGIASRTFFRYFSSKEESVLTLNDELNVGVDEWLAGDLLEGPLLDQLETVVIDVMKHYQDIWDLDGGQMLRVRRLALRDHTLRYAGLKIDDDRFNVLSVRMQERFRGKATRAEVHAAIELLNAELRLSFDEWAEDIEAGKRVSVVEAFEAARQTMRQALSPA